MSVNPRYIIFAAELLAVVALRAVFMLKRDKLFMPRSSKVQRVSGRPVFTTPSFVSGFSRKSRKRGPAPAKHPGVLKVGSIEIPLANPAADGYDGDSVE